MEGKSVVETKVSLGTEDVEKILAAEVAKAVMQSPEWIEAFVKGMLFTRPPKQNSYGKEHPTLFEMALCEVLKPILKEEVEKQATKFKVEIGKIVRSVFKSKFIDTTEFRDDLAKRLSDFVSEIRFYIADH